MRHGFGTSARKSKNGFIGGENCFVAASATKHSGQKCEQFQIAEICAKTAGPAGFKRPVAFRSRLAEA
jgi:hypothetical protein